MHNGCGHKEFDLMPTDTKGEQKQAHRKKKKIPKHQTKPKTPKQISKYKNAFPTTGSILLACLCGSRKTQTHLWLLQCVCRIDLQSSKCQINNLCLPKISVPSQWTKKYFQVNSADVIHICTWQKVKRATAKAVYLHKRTNYLQKTTLGRAMSLLLSPYITEKCDLISIGLCLQASVRNAKL